jgi:hypothetical protein
MKAHLISFGNYLLKTYGVTSLSQDSNYAVLYPKEVSEEDILNWEKENPNLDKGGVPFKAHTDFPSRYKIGEKVLLCILPENQDTNPGIPATIIAVHFTISKVKYDVEVNFYKEHTTRLYNIDGILIKDYKES